MKSNALISFKLPYFLSIIFGTMPVKMKLSTPDIEHVEIRNVNIHGKFAMMTIIWVAFVSIFIIADIQTISTLSPTSFFLKKVVDNFPNDYYCIRLLHNVQIWFILIWSFVSSRKLSCIIDNLKSYNNQQNSSAFSTSWKSLHKENSILALFYLTITTCPIIYDLFQLYREKEEIDIKRILQGTLHCIPLTINLQFCSLCLILHHEFKYLNERLLESRSLFPEKVRKLGQSHFTICQLVRQVNQTYELQLFLETGIVTLNILLHTFHVLNTNNHRLQSQYGDIIYSCLWTIHFTGRLFTTCMIASKAVMQVKKTRTALLQLEHLNRISNSHEQVISLTNRINYQKIEFNICGFFTLGGNLIISVCGWCISFILILLQFRSPNSAAS